MKKNLCLSLSSLILLVCGGCAATTYITSDPPGARITVNNGDVGVTPVTAEVKEGIGFGSVYVVEAKKAGYETAVKVFKEQLFNDARATIPPKIHFLLKPADSVGAKDTPGSAARNRTVSCDLRMVKVDDASVIAAATGQAPRKNLKDLAEALAEKLRKGVFVKGETIAVMSLRNRSGMPSGAAITEELADKISGALVDTDWFKVKERIDLRSLFDERDLENANIVKNDRVREKLGGIKFVVIGGVTAPEERK